MGQSLRRRLFTTLLDPISNYDRHRRMDLFLKTINLQPGMRILDVGGTASIWQYVLTPLHITCLNLPSPKPIPPYQGHHTIQFVTGNGCDMPEFKRGDFDLVFSNSVIEHVGGYDNQKRFAQEVQRLSDTYWIQTPHKLFPIEAHCGMPFWWFYPESLRETFMSRWDRTVPEWSKMVRGTTIIEAKTLKSLFPNGTLMTTWMGFPKALIVYAQKG